MGRFRVSLVASCGLMLVASELRAQAVAFVPTVSTFPSGVQLPVTPVVSLDRRYVRITTTPIFTDILSFDTFGVPAAVSGGPGGPGALGGNLGGLAGGLRNIGVGHEPDAPIVTPGVDVGNRPGAGLNAQAAVARAAKARALTRAVQRAQKIEIVLDQPGVPPVKKRKAIQP
jgi:hypothetical protein